MPELPEVETVCRGLSRTIRGETILRAETRRAGLRQPFPANLVSLLKGARIDDIRRRAKYVLADLDNDHTLVVHLGMSGRILFRPRGDNQPPEKHDHFIIHIKNGGTVVLNDPRRFGVVDIVRREKINEHALFSHLGYEPLDKDFTPDALGDALAGRRTPLKVALMDQRIVVGVGNIYAAEALYMSRLSPARTAGSLTGAELKKLVPAIKAVLEKAIAAGGSSLKDYVQTDGELGYFQHDFKVYGRDGQKCRRCAATIARDVMGGRSTFYCPACQK
jgi:formamidopyrimidine-DNA glycosylase